MGGGIGFRQNHLVEFGESDGVTDFSIDFPEWVHTAFIQVAGMTKVATFDKERNAFLGNVTRMPITIRRTRFQIWQVVITALDGFPDPTVSYRETAVVDLDDMHHLFVDGLVYSNGTVCPRKHDDVWHISEECIACMDNKPDMLNSRCGHVALCRQCCFSVDQCPLCRNGCPTFHPVVLTSEQ